MARKEGQIKQLSPGRFKIGVYIGDGRYTFRTVRGTKTDANKALAQLVAEKHRGELSTHVLSKKPLKALLEHYLEETARTKRVRPSTLKSIKGTFDRLVIPDLGRRRLDSIKPRHLQGWIDNLACSYSPNSVRLYYNRLHRAFVMAVRQGILPANPCPPYPVFPKLKHGTKEAYTWDELRAFLAACYQDEVPLFTLLSTTGLRPSEALALEWDDIDFAEGVLSVSKSVVDGVVGAPKTAKGYRKVKVPDHVLHLLAGREKEVKLIFHDGFGEHLPYSRMRHMFARVCKRAKVRNLGPYSLRHTHATLSLKSGENPKILSDRLGHSSVRITLDIYSHVQAGMQDELAAFWDRQLTSDRSIN